MTVTASLDRIRAYATEHGLRPATLAALAKLHKNALRDLHEPGWNPTASTLLKLEMAIDQHRGDRSASEPGEVAA